jgi:hypothetical protein
LRNENKFFAIPGCTFLKHVYMMQGGFDVCYWWGWTEDIGKNPLYGSRERFKGSQLHHFVSYLKRKYFAWCLWLTPVILAT